MEASRLREWANETAQRQNPKQHQQLSTAIMGLNKGCRLKAIMTVAILFIELEVLN
jgi:hypothetical protein